MKKYKIIVVGATGLVGSTLIRLLEERNFPLATLLPLASARSAGTIIKVFDQEYQVEELTEEALSADNDIAFFAAGGEISKKHAPLSSAKGILTIDNTSYFRMDENVPLIVPEVNFDRIKRDDLLISNPNCSTIQCMAPLEIIKNLFGLASIHYASYQACSGAGMEGLRDLETGIANCFDHVIKNSVLPRIDDFLDNCYTKEEMKMIKESQKILDLPSLPVTATCVRVPIDYGHSVAITVETKTEPDVLALREAITDFEGLKLVDDCQNKVYPIAENVKGKDIIEVGRIRRDLYKKNVLHLWTVADNIRKGAATNAVQIAEKFAEKYL